MGVAIGAGLREVWKEMENLEFSTWSQGQRDKGEVLP